MANILAGLAGGLGGLAEGLSYVERARQQQDLERRRERFQAMLENLRAQHDQDAIRLRASYTADAPPEPVHGVKFEGIDPRTGTAGSFLVDPTTGTPIGPSYAAVPDAPPPPKPSFSFIDTVAHGQHVRRAVDTSQLHGGETFPVYEKPDAPAAAGPSDSDRRTAERWRQDQLAQLAKNARAVDPATLKPAMTAEDVATERARIDAGYRALIGEPPPVTPPVDDALAALTGTPAPATTLHRGADIPLDAPAPPPAGGNALDAARGTDSRSTSAPTVGATVTLKDGRRVRVTAVNPDGSLQVTALD
jgi:hypothetical protein